MPKVIIKKADLPPVSSSGAYVIRTRIVSDDKNTSSYWTPIYYLIIPVENGKFVKNAVMANIYHTPIGQSTPQNYSIHVSWHDPNDLGFYDIYTRWYIDGSGWTDWMHMETLSSRNFSFNPPLFLNPVGGFTKYAVSVTRANFNKEYNPLLALFSTPPDGLSLV